jgi:hypothetical protein
MIRRCGWTVISLARPAPIRVDRESIANRSLKILLKCESREAVCNFDEWAAQVTRESCTIRLCALAIQNAAEWC